MLQLARYEDRFAVNVLAKEMHDMHRGWQPDIYAPAEELYSPEHFEESIRQRQLYVAKIDGAIAGYVLLKIHSVNAPGYVFRKIMFVEELCVDPVCRRQGIGMQMMEDARALAAAFGCSDMQLTVAPQNDAAVDFYQKCGFMIQNIQMQRKV